MENEEDVLIKIVPVSTIISFLPGNFLLLKPDAPDFTILDATDEYCKNTYTKKEQIKSQPLFKVFPERVSPLQHLDELRLSLMRAIHTKEPDQLTSHFYDIQNPETGQLEERYWTLLNVPILNPNGEVCIIIHSVIDITNEVQLKKSEQEAKDDAWHKERFLNLLMQAPLAMCLLETKDLIITSANSTILGLWDKTEDVIGKSLYEVLPDLRAPQNTLDIIKAYRTGKMVYGFREEIIVKDKPIFVNYACQPIVEDSSVTGVLVIVFDVTDLVQASKKVEESEHKFRTLIEQAPTLISLFKGKNLTLEISNQAALKTIGLGSKALGKSMYELIPADYSPLIDQLIYDVMELGKIRTGYERPYLTPGEPPENTRYYNYTMYPIREMDSDITGAVLISVDVTEQVLAKRELEEKEERLHAATEAAELGFWDYNPVTGKMIWDDRCKELYGLPPDAHIEYDIFLSRLIPEERQQVDETVQWALNPESGGHYDIEHHTVRRPETWVRTVGKVFFDDNHKPVRFIGTILDITDKKEEEIRKNDFTAMASHELKTPLTSVKAYVQMLGNAAKKVHNDFFSNALAKVDAQLSKMARMINDFLDLSRMESGRFSLEPERFEINALIGEIIDEIRPLAAFHTITFDRGEDVFVVADRQKIGEVVMNFLSNAIKYSQNHRQVAVQISHDETQVMVTVIDQGIGIPEEDLGHIFQRFYRSKKASQQGFAGFGIGLYLSAEIIQRHHGNIGVRSEEDEGSEFFFSLPIAPKEND